MEILPIEVLANQIFKYFSFPTWLQTLVLVSKQWQQAAISSNASKQVIVDLDNVNMRYACIPTIAKYRVDTLILSEGVGPSGNLLGLILNASPKLNTLVLANYNYNRDVLTEASNHEEMLDHPPKRTFPHITTLSLNDNHFPLLDLFPNVTKLRIEDYADPDQLNKLPVFTKIRELEVTCDNFDGFNAIPLLFPNLETLYLTNLDYATNTEFTAQGKLLGIKVISDNPHLIKASWNLPNISYRLYAIQHKRTPLAYPITMTNVDCTVEKFEEIMTKTSPAYEEELRDRFSEFYFPARITRLGVESGSLGNFLPIRKFELIKPLYANKYLDFSTAFQYAVLADQPDYALELAKELPDRLEDMKNAKIMLHLLTLFEKIGNVKQFLDVVGSEATKKIMTATDDTDCNIIVHWASNRARGIDWSAVEEFIDWNMKVKVVGKDSITQNLATIAFNSQFYDKWKDLIVNKKLEIEFDRILDTTLQSFVVRGSVEDIEILAKTPEIIRKVLFMAAAHFRDDIDQLAIIIAKFGKEQLKECLDGQYLLHYVIKEGRDLNRIIPYLVNEQKLDINFIDKSGKTPLVVYIEEVLPREEHLEMLLNLGADPNLAGDTMLPLFLVMDSTIGSELMPTIVETLIDAGADINVVDFDKNGRKATPLSMAVSKGVFPPIIESLIARGADTKFVDDAGNTLLHTLLLAEGLEEILLLLPILVKHVDINQANLLGETPLHRALLSGYDASLVSALVTHGADVNLPGGPPNQPPLVMALNYFPTIKPLLVLDKIDIKAKNRVGESVFYVLCRINITSGDFDDISALLADKEFLEIVAKLATPENIEFVVSEVKRFFTEMPQIYSTVFELCTREISLLKFLIETVGFDVNAKSASGKTLLSSLTVPTKNSYEIAEYLIQKGADVNVQDNCGNTPLLLNVRLTSVTREQYRFRKLLLKHGASVTHKNNLGIAPIDIDPMIESRYQEEERSMAYYDDRSTSELLTPSLAELRAKRSNSANNNNIETVSIEVKAEK